MFLHLHVSGWSGKVINLTLDLLLRSPTLFNRSTIITYLYVCYVLILINSKIKLYFS